MAGLKILFNSEPVTKVSHLDDCLVLGRYSIQRGTSAKVVADLVLPEKNLIGWRATAGESFPTANTNEVVVFEHFFY